MKMDKDELMIAFLKVIETYKNETGVLPEQIKLVAVGSNPSGAGNCTVTKLLLEIP